MDKSRVVSKDEYDKNQIFHLFIEERTFKLNETLIGESSV
jgi:hypothetical protein